MKYKEYIIAAVCLFGICLLLYNKVLFSSYEFLSGDSYSAKAVEQGIYLAEENDGEYPLWLPWMFSGLPSTHSFQNISDHYYPYKIFKILRDFGLLRFYEFIFHFVFAGMGMLILLKFFKCNFISCMFGAISYITLPYLTANLTHGHGSLVMTACYIPWVIWALINLFDKKNISSIGILGLLVGLQLQRGHVQIAYYTWMMIGLYIIFYIISSYYDKNHFRVIIKSVVSLIISLLLGVGLAASIYIPAMSYTPYSTRGISSDGGIGLLNATNFSFPPIESIVFFVPSFFGFGGNTYWGQIIMTDYPQYLGVIVLIFAIYGCFSSNKIKYFLISASLFALFISFGRHFQSFYSIFYDFLPFFDKFRAPMYILIVFHFCICMLGGIGFNHLFINIKEKKITLHKDILFKILLAMVGFLSIIFIIKDYIIDLSKLDKYGINTYIANAEHKTLKDIFQPILNSMINQDILMALIIIIVLYSIIQFKNVIHKTSIIFSGIILLSIIDTSIVNYKILSPDFKKYRKSPLTERQYLTAYLKEDHIIDFLKNDTTKFRILPSVSLVQTNRWSAFNIESTHGYHPAKLSSYSEVMSGNYSPRKHWENTLLEILNVKYLVSDKKINDEDFELIYTGSIYKEDSFANSKTYKRFIKDYFDNKGGGYIDAYIYKYQNYYNRLYFSEEVLVLDRKSQFEKFNDDNFNPKKTSMLSESINEEITYDKDASVELIKWSPNKIIFKTETKSKQFLNISEVFYPDGWVVNDSIKIYEVNSLIRGVIVDSGNNIYTMEYKPEEVKSGNIISLMSFIILSFLILFGLKSEIKK